MKGDWLLVWNEPCPSHMKDPQVHFLANVLIPLLTPTPVALKEGHSNSLFSIRSNVRLLQGLPGPDASQRKVRW